MRVVVVPLPAAPVQAITRWTFLPRQKLFFTVSNCIEKGPPALLAGKDFRAIHVNVDDFHFLASFVFCGSCFVTIDKGARYRNSGASTTPEHKEHAI